MTENSKNGVNICSVIANDADKNRTITYSLEGSSALRQLIHLDSNNGDLVVSNKIDHEQHPWLNLSVNMFSIKLGNTSCFCFTLNVIDFIGPFYYLLGRSPESEKIIDFLQSLSFISHSRMFNFNLS